MEPIRVLHEVTLMNTGGLETLIMNIYRNIDREKVQFDFMLHRDKKGFYDEEIKALGGRIYPGIAFNPLKQKRYINSLDTFFKEHPEYKIIHAHNSFSMFTLRSAKKAGLKVRIQHAHNSKPVFDKKYPFKQYCKLTLKDQCTDMFACSDAAGEWLFGKKAVLDKKVNIMHNGIMPEKFIYNEETRNRIRKQYNLEGKFVLGHVGRLNTQKNHTFLLDIFKEVYDKNKDACLMLIGEGDLEQSLREKAKSLNIDKAVMFMGVFPDVYNYMQAMDVFVFPSLYEGLGMVAIEAQASGLQCIVADTIPQEAYITEYIKSVKLSDTPKVWSEEILKYNNGYKRRNTFEDIISAGYDIKTIAKQLENFYLKALER